MTGVVHLVGRDVSGFLRAVRVLKNATPRHVHPTRPEPTAIKSWLAPSLGPKRRSGESVTRNRPPMTVRMTVKTELIWNSR
jgi:hypothetical protein